MDMEPFSLNTMQPPLFEFGEAAVGTLELFPAVWAACEELTAPDTITRRRGLHRLLELSAPYLSPLVTYLMVTRLSDPDISLRAQLVSALGKLLAPDEHGRAAPEPVRRCLTTTLGQMRTRSIFALLEVANYDPQTEESIARLFNACPYAGRHLADILSERRHPLEIRNQAIRFIGLVGYLETIPALERLEARLQTRLSGQQAMPFAPNPLENEIQLLPVIQAVLLELNSP